MLSILSDSKDLGWLEDEIGELSEGVKSGCGKGSSVTVNSDQSRRRVESDSEHSHGSEASILH